MKDRKFLVLQLLVAVAVVILSSCAKLPVYKSTIYPAQKNGGSKYPIATGYEKKKNIHYGVAENDSDIFIQFCFHKQGDLEKIMSGGIKIYFDPEVKKGKNYALIIERAEDKQQGTRPLSPAQAQSGGTANNKQQMQLPQENGNSQGPGQGLMQTNNMICKDLSKVTWKKEEGEFVFYRDMYKEKIDVQLQPENPSGLIVTVKMPRNEVPVNDNGLFSLGIETGTKQNTEKGGPSNSSFRQMPPGGMPGGMGGSPGVIGGGFGGMGGGPGRMGGRPGVPGNSQSKSGALNFWVKVELH